jgi:alkanesulfonate monooxygenase SsuD/methylene tetrahydromethanopterin reductase-like flavin-dependent oxidoreductase (luciferase family)
MIEGVNTTELGVVVRPELPPERLREIARHAESAGLAELWLWEDCFYAGGLTAAATALAATEHLRVGVGVIPVPLRNVAITAMEIAGLARLHPGRFQPGLGHGVQDWMGQVGARAASPMTLLREYLAALRQLLDGERVTTEGRYVQLRDVALTWPPTERVSLRTAAVGPKTLALSGALSDGTILTGETTPAQLRQARAIVDQARSEAGLEGRHQLTVYVMAAIGAGAERRLADERRFWKAEPDAPLGIANDAGDAAAVAEGLDRWIEAGADVVVLQPAAGDPDLEAFVEFVARELRPLIA